MNQELRKGFIVSLPDGIGNATKAKDSCGERSSTHTYSREAIASMTA